MISSIVGAGLACLIFGLSVGFLFGCVWHANFALLADYARQDADIDAEGDPQGMDRK
ncbi:hypothetical protein [Novosphingobium sp.]|uniref:hypothetical protein n=1 Tax=Novosphingobium sp. TaxID=1874826 RepID=UPI0038B92422